MTAQSPSIPGSLESWEYFVETCLIIIGLLIVARVIALAVRPNWKTDASDTTWLWWSWVGFAVLVWSGIAWTFFPRRGIGTATLIAAGIGVAGLAVAGANSIHLWASKHGAAGDREAVPHGVFAPPTGIYRSRNIRWGIFLGLLTLTLTWVGLCLAGFLPGTETARYAATSTASAAGLLYFGLALGFRMRMQVTVRDANGATDSAGAAYVLQRMQTMGSHRPRGLKTPQGMDVLDLPEQAVGTLPHTQGKVAAALLSALRAVSSTAPWRADIVIVDDETATVELRRNAGQADSTLLFKSTLGLNGIGSPSMKGSAEDSKSNQSVANELLTAAAAFLLIKLSERHLILTRGLHGARQWRSVTCQVLAGTPPYENNHQAKEQLYATAVEKDPGNEAARLGYLVCRSGGSQVGSEGNEELFVSRLIELCNRLEKKEGREKLDYLPLRLRVKWTLVVAQYNLAVLYGESPRRSELKRALENLEELQAMIDRVKKSDEGLREFAAELQMHVDVLRDWTPRDRVTLQKKSEFTQGNQLTLLGIYNRACCRAESGDYGGALRDLDFAVGLHRLRVGARTDPYLQNMRKDAKDGPKLMALLDKPKLSDIEGFEPHAKQLFKYGIQYPDELLQRSQGIDKEKELAASLQVPLATVEWMRDVCLLVQNCPNKRHALAWTNLLIQEGVDTPDAFAELLREQLMEQHLLKRFWSVEAIPLEHEVLRRWERAFVKARWRSSSGRKFGHK